MMFTFFDTESCERDEIDNEFLIGDNEFLNEVDNEKIIRERNLEIKGLEKDIIDISEIMGDLSLLINEQGETLQLCENNLENIEKNTNSVVISLEKSEKSMDKKRKILRNLGIVAGGIGIGSVGFIVGPLIGTISLLSGGLLGSGIAFISNKFF